MTNANAPKPRSYKSFTHPRYWSTWLILGLFVLVAHIPLGFGRVVGRGIGGLFYRFARSRREITRVNVALCFPELDAEAQDQRVRLILENVGISFMETAAALWGPDWQFNQRYTLKGLDILRRIEQEGQGVLLLGGHYTTLDVAGRIMGLNIECDMIYRVDRNPLLATAIARARERLSGQCIARSDLRLLVKNLRKGRRIWYAPDQDFGRGNTVFAPFFGVPAATVTATAKLAAMGRARVVPFEHYRDADGIYHVEIKEPLENYPSGDDLTDATCTNAVVESVVQRYPEQYLWVHRRFKTRPEGEPSPYPKRRKARAR
ncbi:MAG TPA: LpxL/LpxP family Kdo(2)-lipid IV(A) lauroyl/palmitoleoyl acyltransferase [Cellvibrionaceae bacterium]